MHAPELNWRINSRVCGKYTHVMGARNERIDIRNRMSECDDCKDTVSKGHGTLLEGKFAKFIRLQIME